MPSQQSPATRSRFCCFGTSLPTAASPAPEAQHHLITLPPHHFGATRAVSSLNPPPVGALPVHRGAFRALRAQMLSDGLSVGAKRAVVQLAGFQCLTCWYQKRFAAVPDGPATLTSS